MIFPKRAHIGRALLLPRDVRGRWGARCSHGTLEAWLSLRVARIACRYPSEWCARCAAEGEDHRRRLRRLFRVDLSWSYDYGSCNGRLTRNKRARLRVIASETFSASAIEAGNHRHHGWRVGSRPPIHLIAANEFAIGTP